MAFKNSIVITAIFWIGLFGANLLSGQIDQTLSSRASKDDSLLTHDQKKRAQANYRHEIKKFDEEINSFKDLIHHKSQSSRGKLSLRLVNLENKLDDINVKVDYLPNASRTGWSDLQYGLDAAFREMEVSFVQVSSEIENAP